MINRTYLDRKAIFEQFYASCSNNSLDKKVEEGAQRAFEEMNQRSTWETRFCASVGIIGVVGGIASAFTKHPVLCALSLIVSFVATSILWKKQTLQEELKNELIATIYDTPNLLEERLPSIMARGLKINFKLEEPGGKSFSVYQALFMKGQYPALQFLLRLQGENGREILNQLLEKVKNIQEAEELIKIGAKPSKCKHLFVLEEIGEYIDDDRRFTKEHIDLLLYLTERNGHFPHLFSKMCHSYPLTFETIFQWFRLSEDEFKECKTLDQIKDIFKNKGLSLPEMSFNRTSELVAHLFDKERVVLIKDCSSEVAYTIEMMLNTPPFNPPPNYEKYGLNPDKLDSKERKENYIYILPEGWTRKTETQEIERRKVEILMFQKEERVKIRKFPNESWKEDKYIFAFDKFKHWPALKYKHPMPDYRELGIWLESKSNLKRGETPQISQSEKELWDEFFLFFSENQSPDENQIIKKLQTLEGLNPLRQIFRIPYGKANTIGISLLPFFFYHKMYHVVEFLSKTLKPSDLEDELLLARGHIKSFDDVKVLVAAEQKIALDEVNDKRLLNSPNITRYMTYLIPKNREAQIEESALTFLKLLCENKCLDTSLFKDLYNYNGIEWVLSLLNLSYETFSKCNTFNEVYTIFKTHGIDLKRIRSEQEGHHHFYKPIMKSLFPNRYFSIGRINDTNKIKFFQDISKLGLDIDDDLKYNSNYILLPKNYTFTQRDSKTFVHKLAEKEPIASFVKVFEPNSSSQYTELRFPTNKPSSSITTIPYSKGLFANIRQFLI